MTALTLIPLDRQFPAPDSESIEARLYRRARTLQAKLEATNLKFYDTIREEIQRGADPNKLLQWTVRSGKVGDAIRLAPGDSYDYLDELVSGVLRFVEPDARIVQLPAEMVSYQPTPARHIFDLIARTQLTERDVLIDLGSGLGHVPLLASICTSGRSVGIEVEGAYVNCARRSAFDLNRSNVIIHPARRAGGGFVQRYSILSLCAVPWHDSARRVGLATAGSGQPRDSRLHIWPLHANRRGRAVARAHRPLEAGRIAVFRSGH